MKQGVPAATRAIAASPARVRVPASAGPAAWVLGFALVAYLSFSNGGYDAVVRDQTGIAAWWLVLLGAGAGVLPLRFSRLGWAAVGLLVGFAAWTALSTGWSESAERSWVDASKIATYLGFLVLALAAQRRGSARQTLNGVACAIVLVGVLALLSRLHPSWFPANDQATFLANSKRLAYPLNYWNALAALMGIGVPLMLAIAAEARRVAWSALAAGLVPVFALVAYFTQSRGGVIGFAIAAIVWLVLSQERLVRLATLLVAGGGTAILLAAAEQRPILREGLTTAAAKQAGDDFIPLVLLVVAGVALLQAAIYLADRHVERPAVMRVGRRRLAVATGVVLAIGLAGFAAAGGIGTAGDKWREFKAPPGVAKDVTATSPFARLESATSHHRYQYWQAAADAQAAHPLKGTGSGTFEFWWARHGTTLGFVRDAHSLYLQTFGELGLVGFVLIVGFVALLMFGGAARALRAPPELRNLLAAAVAGVWVWAFTAMYEWIWQMAAMAAVLVLLGAVALAGRSDIDAAAEDAGGIGPVGRRSWPAVTGFPVRALAVVLSLLALPLVGTTLSGATSLRDSRAAAVSNTGAALRDAADAQRVQPYAASPRVQQALVLEERGALGAALAAASRAVREEPTNWRTWFVRSRIQAELGHAKDAVADFRQARRLNPRSNLFLR
jgi:O-antigen ligase